MVLQKLILISTITALAALFQDQVGVKDIHIKNLGRIHDLHPLNDRAKRTIVLTEDAVLAILNKDSSILWRIFLTNSELNISKLELNFYPL